MLTEKSNTIAPRQKAPYMRRMPLILALMVVAYLIAKPVYLFPSGGPQIGDAVIILMFIIVSFYPDEIDEQFKSFTFSTLVFVVYVTLINVFWAFMLFDFGLSGDDIIIHPLFYIFNLATVYIIIKMYSLFGDRLISVLFVGVVVSLILQLFVVLAFAGIGTTPGRETVSFNNPNQLGYWSVLSASIFLIFSRFLKVNVIFQVLVISICAYLVFLSQGRASLIALVLLLVLHFSQKASHLVLLLIAGVMVVPLLEGSEIFLGAAERLQNIGRESHDSIVGRGYFRIWTHPEHLLIGAGEGGIARRWPGEWELELHSTIGTLVFSYGIVGTGLLINALWRLFRLSGLRLLVYLVPTLVFGLVHQGLRFSHFWILLAVIAIVGLAERRRAAGGDIGKGEKAGKVASPYATVLPAASSLRPTDTPSFPVRGLKSGLSPREPHIDGQGN